MSLIPRGRTRPRLLRSAAAGAALAGAALLVAAGPASAHVQVTSPDAVKGGEDALLVFRVPNESDTAGTVKVSIALPLTTPFGDVLAQPIAGWKVSTTTKKLPKPIETGDLRIDKVTDSVTWTADKGVQIAPGQFQQFSLSVGPVPDVSSLSFPATQTYSDGSVVKWNEPTPADGKEPENPTPELTLAAASSGDSAHGGMSVTATSAASSGSTSTSNDGTARVLGVVGIGIAVLAVVAAFALGRRRR